ncbi:MAG: Jag family protein [Thainema sp.]
MNESQQRGIEWMESFLNLANLPAQVKAHEDEHVGEENSCWLTIDESQMTPAQIEGLTGSDGAVLDAIQYLVNTVLNIGRDKNEQQPYTVELAGYRVRRQAELTQMAEQAAQEVRETHREVELSSLSAAERRQIHTLFKEYEELETYSRGKEPNRLLVVRLASNADSDEEQ